MENGATVDEINEYTRIEMSTNLLTGGGAPEDGEVRVEAIPGLDYISAMSTSNVRNTFPRIPSSSTQTVLPDIFYHNQHRLHRQSVLPYSNQQTTDSSQLDIPQKHNGILGITQMANTSTCFLFSRNAKTN